MRQKKPIKIEEFKPKEHNNLNPSIAPSLGPNFLGGVLQGFSFGSGSAIAHNIFGSKPQIIDEEKEKCKFILENYNRVCSINNLLDHETEEQTCRKLYKEINDTCFTKR